MKDLFKQRFPFVEFSNEKLNDEQLAIKKMFMELGTDVPCIPCEAEKTNRLRKVRRNDEPIGGKSE